MSSETRATAFLRAQGVTFTTHTYEYEPNGGTKVSSEKLGADEHAVIKTLMFETDDKSPFVVLMHGDCRVSAKQLARDLGCKKVAPCAVEVAERHSGYQVGGTSPFGLKKALPVYLERSIAELPRIFINGGGRGFLVNLETAELIRVLQPKLVNCAEPR